VFVLLLAVTDAFIYVFEIVPFSLPSYYDIESK